MATNKPYLLVALGALLLVSCERLVIKDEVNTDNLASFDYLWNRIDRQYSYFEQKNIDWKLIYDQYVVQMNKSQSNEEAFEIMANMLNELQDGHVNLVSGFNVSYYRFDRGWPVNYDQSLLTNYYLDESSDSLHDQLQSGKSFSVGHSSYQTGSIVHQEFDINDQILGYIRYSDFTYSFSESQWDYVLNRFRNALGIIIDVRSNGGGDPTNLFRLLERFIEEETYIYTSFLKAGVAHDSFTEGTEAYLQPKPHAEVKDIPVRILINRECYSATSFFAAAARSLHQSGRNIKLIGDYTGGGAGAPGGGELPNGWYYRVSVTQTVIDRQAVDLTEIDKGVIPKGMFTDTTFHFESGVPPHIRVSMQQDEILHGRDNILETAIEDILMQEE